MLAREGGCVVVFGVKEFELFWEEGEALLFAKTFCWGNLELVSAMKEFALFSLEGAICLWIAVDVKTAFCTQRKATQQITTARKMYLLLRAASSWSSLVLLVSRPIVVIISQ